MKTSRDQECQALLATIESASARLRFGCALLTVLMFVGVVFVAQNTDGTHSELIHAMTSLEVAPDSWHMDTKLLWWCLYLVVTGSLLANGVFGFLNGSLKRMLRARVQMIADSGPQEPEQPPTIDDSLNEQLADFHEYFALAQATQYWVLGLLYCLVILGAPTIGLLSITPSPVLWYGTAVCGLFAFVGLSWNRTQAVGETTTKPQNTKVFRDSADKFSGSQG